MRKARQAKVVRNMAQNSFFFRSGMAILLALLANSAAQTNAQTVATEESVNVNGVTRTYLLYIPWKYEPGESALIIALHGRGGGGPGSVMEQYSDLNEKADRTGFAVAYLNGLPDATGTVNWNYYYDPFFSNAPDDIGFVREVIDSLRATIHLNRRRIYVTGTSAGGFMAQRVGVELSDRVAAIGVVEGGLFVFTPSSPQMVPHASAPVSVLILKGDQDPTISTVGLLSRRSAS